MAIKLNSIICPRCGANLSYEEGRTELFCSYCGTKIVVTNENEYIVRHIDEASIKQTEAETMLKLKELELEEKDKERWRKSSRRIYALCGVLCISGAIAFAISPGALGAYLFLAGVLIAEFRYMKSRKED